MLRRRGRIQVRFDAAEREALLQIIEQLDDGRPLATPRRAYEDDTLQAEYDRWVRPEVERGQEADLAVMRDSLASGDSVLMLTDAQVCAWLRGFNQLRLSAGGALGIAHDGWDQDASNSLRQRPEFGMLIALGWLQEELVAALES